MSITREQAWDLLKQYNEEPFHLRHAITVEHVMGWFADKLGYGDEKEFWSIVGLLHDLDFERWPEEHCEKSQELMREAGVDEAVIRATASHGWGHRVDIKPEHQMEKVLFAVDELTGLIGAAALMRPSKTPRAWRTWSSSLSKRSSRTKNLPPAAPGRSSPRGRSCWAGTWMSC